MGGAERHYQEMAERLVSDGHEVQVYTTDALATQLFWDARQPRIQRLSEEIGGVSVRRFRIRHLPLHSKTYYALSRLFRNRSAQLWLRPPSPLVPALYRAPAEPWDVVIAGALPVNSVLSLARRIALRANARFVVLPFCHIGEAPGDAVSRHYGTPAQVWLMNTADAIIALTPREASYLRAQGVDAGRLHIVPTGVDPLAVSSGNAERFREAHAIHGPIVAYLGVNAYDKGTEHLLLAMRRLWSQGVVSTLVLAGEEFREFKRFLGGQPEMPNLKRLGPISDQDKHDLLAAMEIFAMPSRTDSFGQVFLESWSNGKPVIGACAGGIPDVIAEGKTGLMVTFGDVEALAGRIELLLGERALRDRLGQAGREMTLAQWSWESVYRQAKPILLGTE